MGCDPNRANITDMGISEILTEKPLSNQEVISIFDDDKDMEFDVFDNSPTSWRPDFLKTSLKKNNCNDQLPCKASPSVNKPSEQIVGKMRAKPKNSSQDANVCSPQIFNQGEQIIDLKPQRRSPTFSSPACSTSKGSFKTKKPLFEIEKESSNPEKSMMQNSFSQAKKPKIQAKLYDLFCKQPKTIVKNVHERSAKTTSCVKTSDSLSGCDTSVIGNSGDKKFSPSAAMESSNLSLLPNPHTLEKSDAIATEAKKGQDLPKAVIQPFKPVSNTGEIYGLYMI